MDITIGSLHYSNAKQDIVVQTFTPVGVIRVLLGKKDNFFSPH